MERDANTKPRKILKIYTIVEKPNAKGIWLEIGLASENRDGSLSGRLDALPVNGVIHVREPQPRNQETGRRPGNEPTPHGWQ